MTNSKSTKRALLSSSLAIVLCVAMLIGATYAWFTDTASTAVNKIQSGKLDVALEMKNADGEWENAEGKTLQFKKAAGATEGEAVLWEPGCTYELPELRVVNNGNLALKYKMIITGIDGDAKLNEAIEWTYTRLTQTGEPEIYTIGEETKLAAGAVDSAITISGHMDVNAGNEYQNLSIEGISITVYATQATVEYDSNNNTYDENAKYTEVVAAGKTFTGTATLTTGITATNPHAAAVNATGADANVTIEDGTFDGGSNGNNRCVQVSNDATVTINGGTFTVGGDASGDGNSVIYSVGGNVEINGGFFYTDYAWNGFYYVLNQNNSNPGTITVKGGTFVNYNPANGDDNLGGNFVATGYTVVSETQANGDVWYTVVAE